MVPSVQKGAERKARYEAIANAFDSIHSSSTTSTAYCDRWITTDDWFRIIRTEYDLIAKDIDFTASDVHHALKARYSLATFSCPCNGVFRDQYKIKLQARRYCYFVKRTVAAMSPLGERASLQRGAASYAASRGDDGSLAR
jgi:hypothetical protein